MADDDRTQPGDAPTEATPTTPAGATEATPATQAGATEAATQAGPPPAAPKPPKAPGAGMTLPTPVVVIAAIVLVAAIVFGIFSFLGKSSADDDKKKAEDENAALVRDNRAKDTEIEAANEEIGELEEQNASLSEQLGQTEEFAAALDGVLGAGQTAADTLYECATTAYEFILNFLNTGAADQGQAQAVDDRCVSAEDNYNAFNAALNDLASA